MRLDDGVFVMSAASHATAGPALATDEPVICAVCRRQALALGYAPPRRPAIWACDDPRCQRSLKGLYTMPAAQLEAYELRARADAGDKAGAFLEGIGEFNLEALTTEQWLAFLSTVLLGFEESMRRQIAEHVAPF